MIGASGSYAVQGTELFLQPTTAKYVDRDVLGMDGSGHPIYPAIRTFEMTWQLISASDFAQLVAFYNQVQNTGTVAVDLPQWGGSPFQFARYSGCTLSEPMVNEFFTDHIEEVRLLVFNVHT